MASIATPLIQPGIDPDPVELIAPVSDLPVVLVCEHAGQAIPRALGGLGLPDGAIDLHIGWDIGAAAVTRAMAARLGCAAVLQRYSRLVLDCNRPVQAADSIPPVSDGVRVPANLDLPPAERAARAEAIFQPWNRAVTAALAGRPRLVLSVHSFTPRLATRGGDRPWHVGFLYRKDAATSERLAGLLGAERPDCVIGMNEPYRIDDESDWFVPVFGEATGLPHSLLEIRHDLVRDPAGQAEWAELLSRLVLKYLELPC